MEHDKKEMKAVHQKDLDNLLDKFSIKTDFNSGKKKCKFCKEVVNKDNIYSLIRESGAINFICEKSECIAEFMRHQDANNQQNK